jgi:hypothetical protein
MQSMPVDNIFFFHYKKCVTLQKLIIILQYNPSYETDEDIEEDTYRAPNRRILLAKILGVTDFQLSLAQI